LRLHAKLFELVAPASIREAGCLLLMGSEGRGEQTARTDQDNGLLLAHEVDPADLTAFREAFSGALDRFGFPPCPGNVMVRNPVWSQPIDGFIRQLRAWVLEQSPDAAMCIAIFVDAAAVTGQPELLARAKNALLELIRGERVLMARFARLVDTFATPHLGFLSTLMVSVGASDEEMDIKRVGIFPIVHGVRALAMDRGILAQSTAGRLQALADAGAIDADLRRELVSALHLFMEFRLRVQLEAVRRGKMEHASVVQLSRLSTTERDVLRDGLRVVRQLQEIVRYHFQLAAF
jgi:CBS domain-containing protein